MNKQYFIKLLRKYQAGKATPAEKNLLESYYNLFELMPDIRDMLTAEEKQVLKGEIKDNIWKTISEKEGMGKKVPGKEGRKNELDGGKAKWLVLPRRRLVRVAAAAVLFLMLAAGVLLFMRPDVRKEANTMQVAQQKENRIILLPDGSRVVLSAGSRLNYPSSFDGKEKREVFLYGQAFFEIEPNISRPFVVHTENLETVVLGTSFNVKAIPGEADIVVTVRDGKVRVSRENDVLGVITPRQQIVYNKKAVSAELRTVADERYLAWKEQDLLFDNLTVAEAARLLEEKYGVTIAISDPSVGSQRFTATFSRNESLERALESICVFNGVTYQYDKNAAKVIIAGSSTAE